MSSKSAWEMRRAGAALVVWLTLVYMAIGTVLAKESVVSTWQPPAALEDLPATDDCPELMRLANGKQITSVEDWHLRRRELKQMLQYYVYGSLPERPAEVRVSQHIVRTKDNTIEEEMVLQIVADNNVILPMKIALSRPSEQGQTGSDKRVKRPVIIAEVHQITRLPCIPKFVEKRYVFVQYQREDLDPDKPDVLGPAQQAYPDHDWATIAVWAWGASRVVDYLESRDDIDLGKLAVTGHSRGGKAALLAGAMDERFALVAPNGSGCGGAGSFRESPRDAESLAQITDPERFHYWFHPNLRWFAGRENRLPLDQHFAKALVAPRALLCTEAKQDRWANPDGSRKTSQWAADAFRLCDAESKNGFHLREGSHDQTAEDWDALLQFAEWHFFGRQSVDVIRYRP
ncbi:MAG: hypothetical protein R3C28_23875 [Pirellulaceae bacterium]